MKQLEAPTEERWCRSWRRVLESMPRARRNPRHQRHQAGLHHPAPEAHHGHSTARAMRLKDEYISTEHPPGHRQRAQHAQRRDGAPRGRRHQGAHRRGHHPGAQSPTGDRARHAESEFRVLEKYGRDLTKAAAENKLETVVGRDVEVLRVLQVLSAPHQEQPGAHRRGRRRQDGQAIWRWGRLLPSSSYCLAVLPTPASPMSTGLFLVRRGEHLEHPQHLHVAPDDGVQLILGGGFGEIAAIFLQHPVLALQCRARSPVRPLRTWVMASAMRSLVTPASRSTVGALGVLRSLAVAGMLLGADIFIFQAHCLFVGNVHDALLPAG